MAVGSRTPPVRGSLQPSLVFLAVASVPFVTMLRFAEQPKQVQPSQGRRLLFGQLQRLAEHPVYFLQANSSESAASAAEANSSASAESLAEGPRKKQATADSSVKALEMILNNLPAAPGQPQVPEIRVATVKKGSWSDKVGIEPGMEIFTLNGKIAKSMPQKDFTDALKARPLTLEFGWPPGSVMDQARKAGRVAGAKAGRNTAKQLIREMKKRLNPVIRNVKKALRAAVPVAPGQVASAPAAAVSAPTAAVSAPAAAIVPLPRQVPLPGPVSSSSPPPSAGSEFTAPSASTSTSPAPWQAIDPNTGKPTGFDPAHPVPPSPLDALRAAMAIRAGVPIPSGNMLSPQVLDAVAKMAHGKLGTFLPPGVLPDWSPAPAAPARPCPQGSLAPAAAAAPWAAPAAAPGPSPALWSRIPIPMAQVIEKVKVTMTLHHMSFTALQASPTLMAETEQAAKVSIAESAGVGVKPSDVMVIFKAGSVVVKGEVSVPKGMNASFMSGTINKNSMALGKRLIARVKALPNIASVALGNLTVGPIGIKVIQEAAPTTTVTTTTPPIRHLPKPPACQAPPPQLTKGDVAMALAPFKPAGSKEKAYKTKDGGTAWPLDDGGWAFQYPDMAVRMQQDGSTRIVWNKPAYAVEYDESGISYHVGRSVVHRDTNGDLSYQQPTGTMHQEGDTLVYHWCNPNVIVYQTPNGFVYYDDLGMTYRSLGKEITHYTWSGEVLYEGAGGITRQSPDGSVTHWTDEGAVFRHPDGSVSYTPTGERTSEPLSVSDLGLDPFPGAALTKEDVMRLSQPPPLPAAGPAPAVVMTP